MGVREGNFYVFLNRYFYVWWGGRFCWFMLQYWACCTTLATAVAAKIAVPRRSRNGEMGRDSLHCTTRAAAESRELLRDGDAYRGRATHIAEGRRGSPKRDRTAEITSR